MKKNDKKEAVMCYLINKMCKLKKVIGTYL